MAPLASLIAVHVRSYLRNLWRSAGKLDGGPPPFDLRLDAWANVNRWGDYNEAHVHPSSHVSGVFYIDVGGAASATSAGRLVFRRPFSNLADLVRGDIEALEPWWQGTDLELHVQNGTLILFPSALQHWTTAHRSHAPRISVAFNAEVLMPGATGGGLVMGARQIEALRWPHRPGSPAQQVAPLAGVSSLQKLLNDGSLQHQRSAVSSGLEPHWPAPVWHGVLRAHARRGRAAADLTNHRSAADLTNRDANPTATGCAVPAAERPSVGYCLDQARDRLLHWHARARAKASAEAGYGGFTGRDNVFTVQRALGSWSKLWGASDGCAGEVRQAVAEQAYWMVREILSPDSESQQLSDTYAATPDTRQRHQTPDSESQQLGDTYAAEADADTGANARAQSGTRRLLHLEYAESRAYVLTRGDALRQQWSRRGQICGLLSLTPGLGDEPDILLHDPRGGSAFAHPQWCGRSCPPRWCIPWNHCPPPMAPVHPTGTMGGSALVDGVTVPRPHHPAM